jgi:hypothetical protein
MSDEAKGAEAPAIVSAEERRLAEILRAQPLSDERSVRLFEPSPTQEEIAAMPNA